MRFYLASWIGDGSEENPYRPSIGEGSWAAIDLRPDATRLAGRCLVATRDPVSVLPGRVVDLGDDLDDRSVAARTALNRDLMLTMDQESLRGIIAELLILHGDNRPRGVRSRWRPLRATRGGLHRIVMLGETIYEAPAPQLATITEDWTGVSDGTVINGNLTWTELINGVGDWTIDSERLHIPNAGNDGDFDLARAESDLSTDDQYAQVDWEVNAAGHPAGPVVRFHASEQTGYAAAASARNDYIRLSKWDNGSLSTLASRAETIAGDTTYTVRIEVDGSDLTAQVSGFSDLTTTDTSITGHLRTGVFGRESNFAFTLFWIDNFEGGDLGAGGTTVTLAPAGLAATAQALTPNLDQLAVTLAPAGTTVTASALTEALSQLSVTLTPAQISALAQALDPTPAALDITLVPADLTVGAQALDPAVGQTTVTLAPAILNVGAQALSPNLDQLAVELAPAGLAVAAQPLDPVRAGTTVTLTPATLGVTAEQLNVSLSQIAVELAPALLAVDASELVILVSGGVDISSATVTAGGRRITVRTRTRAVVSDP